VANLLNRGYFDEAQLRRAVDNLKDRLMGAGSFLIVNRTHADGSNNGTIFQLSEANKFEIVARMRDGTEIEDIVLSPDADGAQLRAASQNRSLSTPSRPR
jgi:hypothetical protein